MPSGSWIAGTLSFTSQRSAILKSGLSSSPKVTRSPVERTIVISTRCGRYALLASHTGRKTIAVGVASRIAAARAMPSALVTALVPAASREPEVSRRAPSVVSSASTPMTPITTSSSMMVNARRATDEEMSVRSACMGDLTVRSYRGCRCSGRRSSHFGS